MSSIKKYLNLNFFKIWNFLIIYFIIFADYNWTSNGSGIFTKVLEMLFINDQITKLYYCKFLFDSNFNI